MYHPADASVLYSAHKLFMGFEDEYGKLKEGFTGTCFFVESDSHLFLLTNRHNIDAGYKDKNKRQWKLASLSISGYDSKSKYFKGDIVEIKGPIFPAVWDEDVAILKVTGFKVDKEFSGGVSIRHIQREAIADDAFFSDYNASEFVVFSGYPTWHDRHENRPIIRSGIIASDPKTNYTGPNDDPGSRRIAFEGFSFEGSSGSPVFSLAFGLIAGPGLSGIRYRHQRLIGINLGHETDGRTGIHSGISRMIKSTVVLELIDSMIAQFP
jgi:hypothetical protein